MRIPQKRATVVIALYSFVASSFANAYQAVPVAGAGLAEQSSNDLFVTVGKSVIVNSALPIERVSVGFGEMAEATAVSPRELLVNGKAVGETSLIIWQKGGSKQFFDVTVRPSRFLTNNKLDGVRREMSKELPGQNVNLSLENDMVFLRGGVKDMTSADRAVSIASSIGKVVNLLYVDVPEQEAQILLKVRFASVDRSLSSQLGANIFSLGATNTLGSISTQQFSPPPPINFQGFYSKGNLNTPAQVQSYQLSNALNLFFFRPDLDLGATIQALEARGLVETLAEPNVLAENGQQASFLAGGQFPYPVVQGGTTGGTTAITIQFREFGVRLNFLPTITPRGTIHLQVAPEVSALDYANGITLQGFTVPGVSVRNVDTEVELGEGQSFAIGGLLDNRETETFSKIPLIGDIPILGKFFQSRNRNKTNTELMVIVTPQLVRPIPAGQPLPELKYPQPFLPPITDKDVKAPAKTVPGSVTPAPPAKVDAPPKSIPVEKLVESLQLQKPLTTNGGSSMLASGSSQKPAAPMPAAPPK